MAVRSLSLAQVTIVRNRDKAQVVGVVPFWLGDKCVQHAYSAWTNAMFAESDNTGSDNPRGGAANAASAGGRPAAIYIGRF